MRQHPISDYIADIYCHKLKLVIEIDGSIHELDEVKRNDAKKENYFESVGLKVLRFTYNDIKLRLEASIETVRNFILNFK